MTSNQPATSPTLPDIVRDALWHHNVAAVRLLGLCPLLAVSTTVVNGLALGLATLFVITLSNVLVSLLRASLRPEIRIVCFVLVIATLVTLVDLGMQIWFFDLHQSLGIFVPLIVTNCAILSRAEAFASRHPPLPSLVDGFATGAGFAAVLIVLGGFRELAGHGTLLRDADLLLGEAAGKLQLSIPGYDGFLLALMPPGAFIALALLIAGGNALRRRRRAAHGAQAEAATPGR